jgi:hypothetical protein
MAGIDIVVSMTSVRPIIMIFAPPPLAEYQ